MVYIESDVGKLLFYVCWYKYEHIYGRFSYENNAHENRI